MKALSPIRIIPDSQECEAGGIKIEEGSLSRPAPMGIIAWKHELLVVPFSRELAA
jgi:hypothetical protein